MDALPLVDALAVLRDRVTGTPLPLRTAAAAAGRRTRDELAGQVEDYLLPRLRAVDAPLLTVVGGSTGAGKSTLVNSLLGEEVTTAGVLRPTTRAPVLVCAPSDLRWFEGDRVLPGLARTTGDAPEPGSAASGLRLVPTERVPPGLALLDAPDIDSVVEANRALAGQLLAAADLWLFVTTAARYADAVPWDLLRTAQERSTALAVVLNRVPSEALDDVPGHLRSMLRDQGLERAELFAVPELPLADGRLPERAVAPLEGWLSDLAADADARAAVVRTTLTGALASLDARVTVVVDAVEEQAATADRLRSTVAASYAGARDDVDEGVRDGSLLRGEVLARWQEFVGTGEFMRSLESRIGAVRDRLWAAVRGRPAPSTALAGALESGVETLVRDAADRAAERAYGGWRADPAGAELLDPDLGRSSPELRPQIAASVRAWQGAVLDLVAAEGADKRTTARFASFGVNGAGLAVMLAVFAQTGGLTGAEVAVAGGTTAVGQRLLEAVFGDQAVRSLAAKARRDLLVRVDELLDAEAARFSRRLDGVPDRDAVTDLRAALAGLQSARRASPLSARR